MHQQGFCDLQFNPARVNAAELNSFTDRRHKAWLAKLQRRNVDGHCQLRESRLCPFLELLTA